MRLGIGVAVGVGVAAILAAAAFPQGRPGAQQTAGKAVLIVYHGGTPPWRGAADLGRQVDALTQPTTQPVNVAALAAKIRDRLTDLGYRVDLRLATEVRGPNEFLAYDGIILGTPTWFSNMAYPLKRVFDEHLYRIYEQRPGKLGDKVLAGYTTVMERGESGPRCLQALTWALQQLSGRVTEGMVVNVFDPQATADRQMEEFCARFSAALAG